MKSPIQFYESNDIEHTPRLTAPEVANLWSQYQNDTMAICIFKHMLQFIINKDVKNIIKFADDIAKRQIEQISFFLNEEKFAIPHGFTDDDVYPKTQQLFSDQFCLIYIYIMSVNGLGGYSAALGTSVRTDIREYYVKCQNETMELFNKSLDVALEQGIISRPPSINPNNQVEFAEKQSFLAGFFGEQRPLNCIEVTHLFWDLKKIQVSKALTLAFSQVAKSEEIRAYFWRGIQVYKKQINVLEAILAEHNLPVPKSEDAEILASIEPTFSDRLMMHHKALLGATTAGFYGTAIASVQRSDVALAYTRLVAEMLKLTDDGAKIMIKHEWLEEPPYLEDRERLVKRK
ncbi:DUF3231 family protein [Paenibacillus sp. V4I5]|uniref:DUF3231 family protein n=1 Tax=Paenibacillus sp. V4I5 TaxID=3042306 RepID=UPI00279083D0|nr:DUF3231 family protein [Paenibacillus sp. V4I5]MDQ0914910.1 hypothetical protein [Paenibacillus sp. V4I5]